MITSGKLINAERAGSGRQAAPSVAHLSDDLRAAVGRLWRRIRTERSTGELGELQYSVLAFLVHEGPRTLSQIAEHVRVTPPSITRTADRLVELGYAERAREPKDARVSLLAPSAAGAQFVQDVHRMRSEWLCTALERLPEDDVAVLAAAAPILRALAESPADGAGRPAAGGAGQRAPDGAGQRAPDGAGQPAARGAGTAGGAGAGGTTGAAGLVGTAGPSGTAGPRPDLATDAGSSAGDGREDT